MESAKRLSIETFLAVCEMLAAQLRIAQKDRWGPEICQLKFVSFTSEFPEVSREQFFWAAEQWIQRTAGKEFIRYPTWRELMAPIYRTENGLANRSWGFREDLPAFLAPTVGQLALMPSRAVSISGTPDPTNSQAYAVVSAGAPQLPPAEPKGLSSLRLSTKEWREHIERCRAEAARAREVQG